MLNVWHVHSRVTLSSILIKKFLFVTDCAWFAATISCASTSIDLQMLFPISVIDPLIFCNVLLNIVAESHIELAMFLRISLSSFASERKSDLSEQLTGSSPEFSVCCLLVLELHLLEMIVVFSLTKLAFHPIFLVVSDHFHLTHHGQHGWWWGSTRPCTLTVCNLTACGTLTRKHRRAYATS